MTNDKKYTAIAIIGGALFIAGLMVIGSAKERPFYNDVPDLPNKYEVPKPDFEIAEWVMADKVPGGIVVRGTWDTEAQGVFTPLAGADQLARIAPANPDGEPGDSPYFVTGSNIYIFKVVSDKKTSQDQPIPTPVPINGADAATFKPGLSMRLLLIAKDKNHAYVNGNIDPALDAATLSTIPGASEFFKDKNHVYDTNYGLNESKPYQVTPYDSATFATLPLSGYSKDKNGLYYRDAKIDGADSSTAEIIAAPTGFSPSEGPADMVYQYAKDARAVYMDGKLIPGADPSTFSVFTSPRLKAIKYEEPVYSYAKDAHAVYYLGERVPGADPASFLPMDTGSIFSYDFGKDAHTVFEGTTTLPLIDSATVQVLGRQIYEGCGLSDYVKDATRVEYKGSLVPGADPATFQALIAGFGKDKNGIWEGAHFRSDLPMDYVPDCDYG